MANLSLPEIAREERNQWRVPLLVNKVYQQEGYANNFMTDEGLFHAREIILNGETFKRYSPDLADKILEVYGNRRRNRAVLQLRGILSGQTGMTKLFINKIEKGEEFGGQPAGGKRENKGIIFEKEMDARFRDCLQAKKCEGKYAEAAMYILEKCSKDRGSPVIDVDGSAGAKNTSRPLSPGAKPFIMPVSHKGHGELLTDITLIHANGTESFLSLKYSSTLTFCNAGVKVKHFRVNDIMNGEIKTLAGKALLEVLGINNELFCNVFKDRPFWYKKGNNEELLLQEKERTNPKGTKIWKVNVKNKMNKFKFKRLISTAIGSNYYMVHGLPPSNVWFWNMTSPINQAASKPIFSGPVWVYYGGKLGNGKRIDMEFSNAYFDFKLNIRNKQGGLYPSHLMLDYKSKGATGKQQIN